MRRPSVTVVTSQLHTVKEAAAKSCSSSRKLCWFHWFPHHRRSLKTGNIQSANLLANLSPPTLSGRGTSTKHVCSTIFRSAIQVTHLSEGGRAGGTSLDSLFAGSLRVLSFPAFPPIQRNSSVSLRLLRPGSQMRPVRQPFGRKSLPTTGTAARTRRLDLCKKTLTLQRRFAATLLLVDLWAFMLPFSCYVYVSNCKCSFINASL